MNEFFRVALMFGLVHVSSSAIAQVATNKCTSLNFYGNAAGSGLCKNLSPATQNLAVCELSDDQPDVHLTFQIAPAPVPTELHLTVRTPQCEGNVQIMRTVGVGGQQFVPAATAPICGVSPVYYVARMNAQPISPAGIGQTICRQGFLDALGGNRLTPAIAQGYLAACATSAPVNNPCP